MIEHLVRMTKDDYRSYRRSFERVEYSYFKDGDISKVKTDIIRQCSKAGIFTKQQYLNNLKRPGVEMYFIKNEMHEIIGVTILLFQHHELKIAEFSVFQRRSGTGTRAFNLVVEMAKARGVTKISLWCPFDGAKEFWKSVGFRVSSPRDMSRFERHIGK